MDKSIVHSTEIMMKKCIHKYNELSDIIILLNLKGKILNIAIIFVYTPTTQRTEEELIITIH